MNLNKILTYFIILIVGGGLGYFIGKSSSPAKTADNRQPGKTTEQEKPAIQKLDTVTLPENNADTPEEELTTNEPETPANPQTQEEQKSKPANTDVVLPTGSLCYDENLNGLSKDLTLFAQKLERDSLWYNNREPEKLLDCSGIFHRVARYMSTKCDAYQYPDITKTRDTRLLAGWFYDNENLAIIHDAVKQRHLIKPGSVMFFGKSGKSYNNLTIERLKMPIPNNVIMHVGVVTDIETDDNGDLIRYTMFHGRREGKIASSTHYHKLKPPRTGFPALGNWNQQLVAIASIMTPE